MSSSEEFEKRLGVLEDVEAIRRLKARYCQYVDERNEDGWVSLFTEDAVWDGGDFGRYEGKTAIREFFRSIPRILTFAVHYVMNPLIEVKGARAYGKWYLLEPCTFSQGAEAVWGAAHYDEIYVKTGTQWKFQEVKLTSWFWTPYAAGWARTPFARAK